MTTSDPSLRAGFLQGRRINFYSLSTKLIVAFLIITLVPLSLLAILNDRATREVLTDQANQSLFAAASRTAASIDNFIITNLNTIQAEAQIPDFVEYLSTPPDQRPDSDNLRNILASLRDRDAPYINSYALLDREGIDVADTFSYDIGLNKADRDYFRAAIERGQPYVSPVQFTPLTGTPVLYFSSPVRTPDGEIVGVLRARYSSDILRQLIAQNTRVSGRGSFAVLFDENHIHLVHGAAPATVFKAVAPLDPQRIAELQAARRLPDLPAAELSTNLPDLDRSLSSATTQPFFTATDVATGDKINQVAVQTMRMQPWLVAFFQPEEVFLAPVKEQTRNTLLLVTVIAAAAAVTAVFLGRRLADPITRLTAVAQQVADGNLTVQAPVEGHDETGQLAMVFNSMTAQLRNLIDSLEDQVWQRTNELALSLEVGQRAAAIRDLDELLPTITELIRERFDLYYTQIYFVDALGQNLVVRAGSGTVGRELLARRHNLPVGPGSIVGQAAAEGQAILVSDTETGDIHKPNPLLPETRSEVAVPLMVEGRVIGVLDMQATRPNTFTIANLTVFEAMATQLAISIDGAQQWALAQEAQQKAETAIRQLTRESWANTFASRPEALGFSYDLFSVTPVKLPDQKPNFNNGLSAPIFVQNEPIGQLFIEMSSGRTLSQDEQNLLAAVTQQLGQKLESLRLFEDVQRNAWRDHVVSESTAQVWASAEVEEVMKAAVTQLGDKLRASEVVIRLGTEDELMQK